MKRTAWLLAIMALLLGCSDGAVTESAARQLGRQVAPAIHEAFGPDVESDLAILRRVTARFHEFDSARQAGWSAQITPCMVDPGGAGGMGFHYGNTNLINGSARVDQPQLLLYEPEVDGRLRLVAVEYIIPYTFHSREADPPVLFGQKFQRNDTFQLWGLHAWVWKENPSGIFANWNPRVTCANTDAVSHMAH